MEPASLVDDGDFWLPTEFLTDADFLVEKENKESVFPYEPSHGFGDEESFLAGLSRKMAQSTLEDDFSGAEAWSTTRPTTQSSRCGGGYGCQTRVSSSQAAAWDLYCAAAEELAMMNLNGYNNSHSGRRLVDLPKKHSLRNDGSGFYSRQSLQFHKLQAIQFQQLKQQQLMKYHRQLAQQRVNNHLKSTGGHMDLAASAWRNQQQRRAVSLGDRAGKGGSTGTGVFLPRSPVTAETRKRPKVRGTVLVPARVAHVLNRNESVVHLSSASFNDASRRQRSNSGGYSSQLKIEQTVNEPRLPSDWAY